MPGRITLVGAGEMMSSMSGLHRTALRQLGATPRPVFLDTCAGYETNIDAICEKAVEYYAHHLQTELHVARFRHHAKSSPTELAAAVSEIRQANLIFAGPGSPTYAIRQWRDSPVWEAVIQRFNEGADLFFASAASITVGRYSLPVYEVYKAGYDPYWEDGLDVLGMYGLPLAVVPHFDDQSGGENYDSRFCYMGAIRFDALQEQLPKDVAIMGLDAYTAICFDPATQEATVSGQGGVTLIGEGGQQRYVAGDKIPFAAFSISDRTVAAHDTEDRTYGYGSSDADVVESAGDDPAAALRLLIENSTSMVGNEKLELLMRLQALTEAHGEAPGEAEGPLVDLVLELRSELRSAKRFDLADKARDALVGLGFEVSDSPQGATWTRR
jgi:cyanophycinase-like exopeptidase